MPKLLAAARRSSMPWSGANARSAHLRAVLLEGDVYSQREYLGCGAPCVTDEADISEQAACTLTVFHDGSCALCQREIALAQRATDGANISFVDVSATPGAVVAPGLTADAAMRRFHVRRADGTLVSGARAFIELWSQSPRLRWLSKLSDWPVAIRALDALYSGLLVVRPPLSRLVRRIDTHRAQRSSRNT